MLVTSNLHVAAGATLTIQPGVTVRFAAGGGAGLTVEGRLMAVGTAAKPIYMTSVLDHGSRFSTAPEGFEANNASAGDWEGVRLTGKDTKSVLEHVNVRYSRAGLLVDGSATAALAFNSFRDDIIGLSVAGQSGSVTSVSDSFAHNSTAVQVVAGKAAFDAATFSYGPVGISGATGASVSVTGSSVVAGTVAAPVVRQVGFDVAMNGADALKTVAPVVAKAAPMASIAAGLNSGPVGDVLNAQALGEFIMPSFVAPLTGWSVPAGRGTPNAFNAVVGTAPYTNTLQIGIAAAQAGTATGLDNTIYQGRQFNLAGTAGAGVITASLFVPATWQNYSTSGPIGTYMWGLGTGGTQTDYAVIGFRNYVTGAGRFTIWDDLAGAFTDLPAVTVKYGDWNNLTIYFSGSSWQYFVNGVQVGTMLNNYSSTRMGAVFMSSANFFSASYNPATFGNVAAQAYTSTWADSLAPSITQTSIPSQVSGAPLGSFQLNATEGAPPYVWSFGTGGVPLGSNLAITTGGVLTSTGPSPGTYSVPIKVTDAEGTVVNQLLSWAVASPLTIAAPAPPAGAVGRAYSYQFVASGTALWGLASSASTLPSGLTISSAGLLSGTPATGSAGNYSFTVQATASNGSPQASASLTIYNPITITTSTLPAGVRSQTYTPTTVVAVGGAGTYTFTASGLPTGLSINSTTGQISGTPTVAGSFTAVVTASDTVIAGLTATANLGIILTVPPLTITTPTIPAVVAVGGSVSATFSAAGGTTPYSFTSNGLPPGLSLSAAGVLSGTASTAGVYNFAVQVSDSGSASASTTLSIGVLGFTTSGALPTGTAGVSYATTIAVLGAANAVFSGANVNGLVVGSNGVISGTPVAAGSFTVNVTVTASGASVSAAFPLTVIPRLAIAGGALAGGQVQTAYSAPVTASGGNAPYVFARTGGTLPTGLQLDSATGLITGTPTLPGASTFTITVTDSSNPVATASADFTLAVSARPLTITPPTLPALVAVNGTIAGTFVAAGGTVPLTFSSTDLPAGVTLSSAGVLGGNPSVAGVYNFSIRVTDSVAVNAITTVTLGVLGFTTTSPLPPATTGTPYSTTVAVAGAANAVFSGATVNGLAVGANGIISGSPAATGTFTINVTATVGAVSITSPFGLTVTAAPVPLTLTGGALASGQVPNAYTAAISASGGRAPYTFSITAGALPAGLLLDAQTGLISGTPATAGNSSVTIQVRDSNATPGTASAVFTISIAVPLIRITAPTLPAVVAVNGAVSGAFSATGGTPPYTFTPTGLPAGVTMTAGVLGGTATTPGIYNFSVRVTDSASANSTANLTLGVLGISTAATLPTATAGTAYSTTISAQGGTVVFSGATVNGLSVGSNGIVSGTPTAAGSFIVNVTATASGATVSAAFNLTVIPGLAVIGGTLPAGQVLSAFAANIPASGGKAPYTFVVTGGDLPGGLQLDGATGLIRGTPATAGSSTFTVQVQDSNLPIGTTSGVFTLIIRPPALTFSASFPQGVVGVNYPNQVITGTAGVAPYRVAVTAGSLPPGLALDANGNISGVPTTAGTSTFALAVSDSNTPATTVTAPQSIVIVSNASASLVLSQTSVAFKLSNGATAANLPDGASITVGSSIVLQQLNYIVSGAAAWLAVTPTAAETVVTPGNPVAISLNASSIALTPGTYTSTIVVACVTPSPCAGTAQNITVTLTVNAPPPSLTTSTPLLSFQTTGTTVPPGQFITIANAGGGTVKTIAVTRQDTWFSVAVSQAILTNGLSAGKGSQLQVTINPNNGLKAGYYTSSVTVTSDSGTVTIPISLQVAANLLSLSQSGQQFTTTAGSTSTSAGSFSVGALAAVSWSAAVQPGAPWLTVTAATGSSGLNSPGSVSYQLNSQTSTLTAGTYFGTIQISSNGVTNSPLSFVVALNVTPVAAPVVLSPSPAGLLFVTNVGVNPASKAIAVNVNSTAPVTYQASSSAFFASVSPATGSASSGAPGSSTVSINTARLVANTLYSGQVGYQTNGGSPASVNIYVLALPTGVTLPTPAGTGSRTTSFSPQAAGCTPSRIFAAQTGLPSNFQQRTALPAQLSVLVINDCGTLVTDAAVSVSFSNGDSPIPLSAAAQVDSNGVYSGTWTPTNPSSQTTVLATATSGSLSATVAVTGQVTSSGLPLLTKNSTTNVYSAAVGGGVAPGSIVSLYGANLSSAATVPTALPLPTTLNRTSVTIGGIPAPLYYVGPNQINAQIPTTLLPDNQYQVVVTSNGAVASPDLVQITAVSPGIAEDITGLVRAQHAADFSLITAASPVKPGEYVTLYLSGLGATTVTVASGAASPRSPLALVKAPPTLTLKGANVPVAFAGLTPDSVGLYQINFQVPAATPDGDLQLVVTQAGVSSQPVILPVKR